MHFGGVLITGVAFLQTAVRDSLSQLFQMLPPNIQNMRDLQGPAPVFWDNMWVIT